MPEFTLPTRTVTFALDERWAGRILRFRLSDRTHTADVQVPRYKVEVEVGAAGEGQVELFPNDLGLESTEWIVEFPDGSRRFVSVPDGVGSVALSTLLGAGV